MAVTLVPRGIRLPVFDHTHAAGDHARAPAFFLPTRLVALPFFFRGVRGVLVTGALAPRLERGRHGRLFYVVGDG